MSDLAAIKALSAVAFHSDPIDQIRQEAAQIGPIPIMVMPDGSLCRLPGPEIPDLSDLKEPKS